MMRELDGNRRKINKARFDSLGIAEGGEWDRFNQQFMETIGCYCDFALELEESGF